MGTGDMALTVIVPRKEVEVLKQIQREDLADSMEGAILWCVEQAGERMGEARP